MCGVCVLLCVVTVCGVCVCGVCVCMLCDGSMYVLETCAAAAPPGREGLVAASLVGTLLWALLCHALSGGDGVEMLTSIARFLWSFADPGSSAGGGTTLDSVAGAG